MTPLLAAPVVYGKLEYEEFLALRFFLLRVLRFLLCGK